MQRPVKHILVRYLTYLLTNFVSSYHGVHVHNAEDHATSV